MMRSWFEVKSFLIGEEQWDLGDFWRVFFRSGVHQLV
jgi:hypothetical protein